MAKQSRCRRILDRFLHPVSLSSLYSYPCTIIIQGGPAAVNRRFCGCKNGIFRCRFFLFFREKVSGLLHIFLDGGLERLHRFKLHFRTQELMQLHMDHLAVQIARKVEQMRLDGRCTAV